MTCADQVERCNAFMDCDKMVDGHIEVGIIDQEAFNNLDVVGIRY